MQQTGFPNPATPLGSSTYYVVRFSPVNTRDNLASVFLWKQQLLDLYALSDPGVARMKLQWWQDQILLPVDVASEHPLARKVAGLIQKDTKLVESIKLMISETDRHLHRQPYEDFDDFWQGCEKMGGSLARIINAVSSSPTKNPDLMVGAYAIASEWLQLMGQHIRHDIRLIPQTLLAKHSLRFDQLLDENRKDQSSSLLWHLHQHIDETISLPVAKRSAAPLYKYYRLRKKMMDLLVAEDFDVLNQKISLTPIRKLWFAL